MTPAARERLQVRAALGSISAAAWMLLALAPSGMALLAHGAMAMPRAMVQSAQSAPPAPPASWMSLGPLPPLRSAASLAAGWALMLAAMMLPLLTAPVRHVHDRSFARRRGRAIALFIGGYAAAWMGAGAVLLALAAAARPLAHGSPLPLAAATIVALVWQASPVKQRCLNRCHAQPELAAFGLAAEVGALRFGLTHGAWCVGSCWALMLLPLLVARGHVAAMAAVTLLMIAERLERATPPRWRWRVPGKAARLLAARVGASTRRGCQPSSEGAAARPA